MKKITCFLLTIFVLLTLVTACDSEKHIGEAKTPSGSRVQEGRNYKTVVEEFEKKGFTNIETLEIDDLLFGLIKKEGSVAYVSVGGDTDYGADVWVPSDTKVIVAYHTFSKDKESTTSEPSGRDIENVTLTIDNCADFKDLLGVKSEYDPSYEEFVKVHKGERIEFDGNIIHVMKHGNYKTRYDILLSAGDYAGPDTANPGPIFKFEDVGVYELGVKDLFLPSYISPGNNVKIVATIEDFNTNAGVLEIKPESVLPR